MLGLPPDFLSKEQDWKIITSSFGDPLKNTYSFQEKSETSNRLIEIKTNYLTDVFNHMVEFALAIGMTPKMFDEYWNDYKFQNGIEINTFEDEDENEDSSWLGD